MVPEPGDYYALAGRDNAQALVRSADGIELLSNICRHRQAVMLKGRGSAPNIVCPLHRWTYDLKGQLLGAPQFNEQPCASLARTPMQRWNGLLFDGPRDVAQDLAGLSTEPFDFSGYVLDKVELHECNYNWKSFIEVYLEDYHVGPFHPGPRAVRHLRRPEVGVRALGVGAARRHQQQAREARHEGLCQVARGGAALLRRPDPAARRDLADLLPERDARVVSARPRRQHAGPEGAGHAR